MTSKATTILAGAAVVTPTGLLEAGTVTLSQGKISEVQREVPASLLLNQDDVELIPLGSEFVLSPGLIDIQLNGAFGCDFGQATIPSVQQLLNQLPQAGITGILATLITAPLMDMVAACNTLEEVIHITKPICTRLLGIHLEGPFLNPAKAGAHEARSMLEPSPEALTTLLSPNVKLMTLAPEIKDADKALRYLQQQGVRAFAGHSKANKSQLETAIQQGLLGVTHLMNAMDGLHHREPGTALHVLNDDRLWASLIADGEHVHPDMLALILKTKPLDKLILVSDAMPLAGQEAGSKVGFGSSVVTHNGRQAVNAQGTLAGSVQFLPEMVRHLVKWHLCSFEQAIQMATLNPARLLGLDKQYGSIAKGLQGDLVLWDRRNLDVVATWINGQVVWCKPERLPQPVASIELSQPLDLATGAV